MYCALLSNIVFDCVMFFFFSLHIKIHTLSMGPYDVAVSEDVDVKEHSVKSHLPGRPYECNLCPKVKLHQYF